MATEQDWATYADQAHLKTTDTLLARTSAGAGVEVTGDHVLARRSDGGVYTANGDVEIGDYGSGSTRTLLLKSGATTRIQLFELANTFGFTFQNTAGSGFSVLRHSSSVSGVQAMFFARDENRVDVGGFSAGGTQNFRVLSGSTSQIALRELDDTYGFTFRNISGLGLDILRHSASGTGVSALFIARDTGIVRPGSDNAQSLGTASFRWSVVYAGTGTINTSDEREKAWRGGLTKAELRAAKRIAGELGFYRWLDAVAEKGDGARLHFGARAQQVWSIMADEGLVDPIVDGLPGDTPYAFLCFDQWDHAEALLDEDGNVVAPPRDAGNRFGLRVDQLALFLIAAQEQRIAALEALL